MHASTSSLTASAHAPYIWSHTEVIPNIQAFVCFVRYEKFSAQKPLESQMGKNTEGRSRHAQQVVPSQ